MERSNLTIALKVLYTKQEKIYPSYVSKNNLNRGKQVIILMISIGQKWWHYLAVKKLSALLRRIATKNKKDFYCLNSLYSFRTKTKIESHKKVCDNKDFCNVIMPFEDTTILEFNQYQKSDKAPFIICADFKYIIEKIDVCKNNHEKLCSTKANKDIPSSSCLEFRCCLINLPVFSSQRIEALWLSLFF